MEPAMSEDFEWDDYAATVDHDLAYEDRDDATDYYPDEYSDCESGNEDSYLDSSYEDRYDLGDY
jgi:hypothetical protein